jgi:UTP--glucose-1-phosphate uridylyltransferase
MRAGHYLCFYGMHVFTPALLAILERRIAANGSSRIQLSPALADLACAEQYLALEEPYRRYDVGARYGLLMAQLALAVEGRDRAEVLAQLVEFLAVREMEAAVGRSAE